jgi:hypothetical protein
LINWVLFHYIIIAFFMHERFDSNRICLFETIRIVDFSSIYWLRVESFYDHSVEMTFFTFIDFRNRREINEFGNQKHDIDEMITKWQRNSKITWSKEKIFRDEQESRFSEKSRWIKKWRISKYMNKNNFYIISWISHLN